MCRPRKRGDIGAFCFAREFALFRESLYKTRVRARGTAAQGVVEMTNNKFCVAVLDEPMEQSDRISSARNAHKIALLRRETSQRGQCERTFHK